MKLRIIPLALSLLLAACQTSEKTVPTQPVPKAQTPEAPFYEQVLQSLRSNDSVIPIIPDVHPIRTARNEEAIIPPQCYTRTEGQFNPCYVCHQDQVPNRENTMNDADLQVAYSFSDVGLTNHWNNLFEDRSDRVSKISDEEIRNWVDQDNYSALAGRLKTANFAGWIPDLENLELAAAAFDDQGFALDGSHWVAFNYKPLPSTFWPTNGATDDVMIRLPAYFRTNKEGTYSRDIYMANLAIVEAKLKGFNSVSLPSVDETVIGIDLNQDGNLGTITEITRVSSYVGAAEEEYIDTYQYPEGTEFLHTVRYLGFDENDEITLSKRMKEVRYMKKLVAYRKSIYKRQYQLEAYEKELGHLPQYAFLGDYGLDNGYGWAIHGFIEDRKGELRAVTYEENLFCMGCHTSIGATIDKTFSFPRKVDGAEGWGYINLRGMPDAPNMGEEKGEIATYFERVGGGGEFRSNPEMFERWFHKDGTVNHQKISQAKDLYELIVPSKERALELNKAYKVIVEDQDFIYGRDATATPPENVYDKVDNETSPTLPEEKSFKWDIRLDWAKGKTNSLAER